MKGNCDSCNLNVMTCLTQAGCCCDKSESVLLQHTASLANTFINKGNHPFFFISTNIHQDIKQKRYAILQKKTKSYKNCFTWAYNVLIYKIKWD